MSARVAAVTGAGSGIGRQLAIGLARRGRQLALCDVDAEGLEVTRVRAAALGVPVDTAIVDVADRQQMHAWSERVVDRYAGVHEVFNNAGVAGAAGAVLDLPYAEIERVININLWGVIHGTKEFLPHLITSGAGNLINISSLNGLFAQPQLATYSATKFGVRGFTEAVRGEMLSDGLPVTVTVVHPGGIKTNIATAALEHARAAGLAVTADHERNTRLYNDTLLRASPVTAATTILDGVAAGRERILIGTDATVIDALVRLLPAHTPRVAVWASRRLTRRRCPRNV